MPESVLLDLKARYSEPQRAYHTWRHIDEMLNFYATVSTELGDSTAVLWAILFHDAIYDPTRGDNEQRSAELLAARRPQLSDRTVQFAIGLVLATTKHAVPDDLGLDQASDAAIFLDIDLSILGAPSDRFDEYEAQSGGNTPSCRTRRSLRGAAASFAASLNVRLCTLVPGAGPCSSRRPGRT